MNSESSWEEQSLDLADELFEEGEYQESLRIYLDLEEFTNSSDLEELEGLDYCLYLWMKIAKAYSGLGELEKSRDYCIKIEKYEKDVNSLAVILNIHSWVEYYSSNFQQCLDLTTRVISLKEQIDSNEVFPEFWFNIYYIRAKSYLCMKLYDEGLVAASLAVEQHDNSVHLADAYAIISMLYYWKQDCTKTIEFGEKSLKACDQFVDKKWIYFVLYWSYRTTRGMQDAIPYKDRLLKEFPDSEILSQL